ncbi:MAG: hypothetical protein JSS13_06245 [Proteobacteria bacterium]|nr:hypothetical protein [Pseudomonadota bacterium]
MYKSLTAALAASLLVAGAAFARDAIDEGRLLVKPAKNNTFSTGEFIMGKAELYGYLGDLKDSKKITGIVLQDADRATPEQKHLLVIAAQAQKLDALVEEHGKLEPLADPTPSAPVAAPSAPAQ